MHEVKITSAKLAELRMLADWQLLEMGFDPISITLACMDLPFAGPKPKFFPATG
jgi:hypothetical protein